MKQSRTQIAHVFADCTLKHGVTKQISREIAAYLLSEGRVNELESVVRDVQADWASAGRVEAVAYSAHNLSPSVRADIVKQVKNLYPKAMNVIVTEVHDPEVIGGVRLQLPNQQLDLSVGGKLHKFKQLTVAGKD